MATSSHSVSREEFDAHRESVSRDISGLAEAIREESRQRGRDTAAIRDDIKGLAMRSTSTPHTTLIGWAGVILIIAGAMGALFQRGTSIYMESMDERIDKYDVNMHHEIEASTELSKERILAARSGMDAAAQAAQAASRGRDDLQGVEISELQRRLQVLEGRWEGAHGWDPDPDMGSLGPRE